MSWIPCQWCHQQYTDNWPWFVCDECGFRICMNCFSSHSGPYAQNGGYKCSQCRMGTLRLQSGNRSEHVNYRPISKLDEHLQRVRGGCLQSSAQHDCSFNKAAAQATRDNVSPVSSLNRIPDGIILTNTALIAGKYKYSTSNDVRIFIQEFISNTLAIRNFLWELIDLGSEDMIGALGKDASWMDYAQLLSDYADGVGITKSANTPLFIIGGSEIIPMPDFYASIGHDVKTIEDSDLLYCFPIDYAWKKVSINDAIFNVARLPLDYGEIESTLDHDLGTYFARALESLKYGIPFTYAMMTSNSGKTENNDWTWTSADVMSKLPQQHLENDGVLTKDNMFLSPALNVLGEEHLSNEYVLRYKQYLEKTDMLFINLHGSPNKEMSGYLGAEGRNAYWGMTTELMKQLRVPVINAFPCYGARYGQYYFDNNDGSVPDCEVYDREDSMLLTAFYNSNVLLFTGSCTCSMCSNVIGSGSATDHINDSTSAIDLLMPAGYAEAMLKLYACYLIQGEPAGYAFLHAKIDYLNYRAKYENKDLVFLTLNQFNLFGCPTLYLTPQTATRQLQDSFKSFHVESKELPDVNYKTEFDRFEQGIDGVLNRVRTLVDNNLKAIDVKIRKQLYDSLGLAEDNLTRIESVEYNGQQSYNLTYSKKHKFYPKFYVVQTDKYGNINEVLESR